MMRINLLPTKAARKQVGARQELLLFAGGLAITVAGLFAWWTVTAAKTVLLEDKVAELQREYDSGQKDKARVDEFAQKAKKLEQKVQAIQQLKNRRTGPAKLLDDLANIFTAQHKVWLTRLEERDGTLTLEGGAMEHEDLSEFQMALGKRSKLISDVRLSLVTTVTKDGVTYLEWKLTCTANYGAQTS